MQQATSFPAFSSLPSLKARLYDAKDGWEGRVQSGTPSVIFKLSLCSTLPKDPKLSMGCEEIALYVNGNKHQPALSILLDKLSQEILTIAFGEGLFSIYKDGNGLRQAC